MIIIVVTIMVITIMIIMMVPLYDADDEFGADNSLTRLSHHR